ncbi:hypothetical protein GCM10011506_31310 [Marivirga lumbricoides]|uniref:Uncharacterized protein n=1 Tax=Marivirga lumbricoides TaxID=1046115 RepID=A0ABQ1MMS1_9BACT|nr:hypothetical protein GCM10011506_31310 [Marivirga lumbricoides]
MKKPILLSLSVLIALVLINQPKASAQSFHIVASFGTTHQWNVPASIEYEVYNYYPYHNWVHVNRIVRGRRVFYNVLLEQDGFFTELQFGNYSRILRVQHFVDYPLYDHYCSAHCGYHERYYVNQRVVNNYYYYGGHNHYVYRARPSYLRQPVRPHSVRYADKNYRHVNGRSVADNSRIISSARESRPTSVRSVSNNNNRSSNNDRTVRSNSSNRNYASNSRSSSTVNRSQPAATERQVTTTRTTSSTRTVNRGSTTTNNRNAEVAKSSRTSSERARTVSSRPASSTSRSSGTSSARSNSRGSSSSERSSSSRSRGN